MKGMTLNSTEPDRLRGAAVVHVTEAAFSRVAAMGAAIGLVLLPGHWLERHGLGAMRPSGAVAQTAQPVFSAPVVVGETNGSVSGPQIVVDAAGRVHLFYVETREDGSEITLFHVDPEAGPPFMPNDVLVGLGADYRDYRTAADPFGNVHVIYRHQNQLWHMRAPGDEAGDARAWTAPVSIGGVSPGAELAIDSAGRIHVCFPRGSDVRYARSDDRGASWSQDLVAAALTYPSIPVYLACAVDTEGVIHVAWGEAAPPSYYPSKGTSYTRSDDDGATWDEPERLGGEHMTLPELLADEAGNVHLLWQGDIGLGGRYYRVRRSGQGSVWSDEEIVVPIGLGGMSGDAPLAIDGDGNGHAVTSAPEPVWVGRGPDGWGSAVPLAAALADEPNASGSIEHPAFGISSGNKAHVAFEFDFKRIYYVGGFINAMDVRAEPKIRPESSEGRVAPSGLLEGAIATLSPEHIARAGRSVPSPTLARPDSDFDAAAGSLEGLAGRTWLLWMGPTLAFVLVAGVVWWRLRQE